MADYIHLNGENLADHARSITAPLRRWAENMAVTERVRLLRAWTGDGPKLDERATRGELKDWTRTVLAELDRSVAEVADLRRELARACEERDETLDALTAETEAHDADVAQLGDERDELRSELRAAHCERDRVRTVECEHGVRVTVRLHGPGEVAQSDIDV